MDMPPDLRTQVDYVFCFKESILTNKMKLWKYFFGMFERFPGEHLTPRCPRRPRHPQRTKHPPVLPWYTSDFQRVMDRCTENHGVLVLDNTAPTTRIEDCVFWYKARIDLPPFRMGRDVYWRLAEQLAKTPEHREKEMRRALEEPASRGSGPCVVEQRDEAGQPLDCDDGLSMLVE